MKQLTRNQWIAVATSIVVVAFFFGLFSFFLPASLNNKITKDNNNSMLDEQTQKILKAGSLVKIDIVVGTGIVATVGSVASVHYLGILSNGKKFDSSYDRGVPFEFTIGAGEVIRGWDQGILGMKIGGKRRLIIPPNLGYGSETLGPIPANSTLIFDVELVGVK